MNILMLTWENFGTEDMKEALGALGHEVTGLPATQEDLLGTAIREKLAQTLQTQDADFVFSFNYFPEVAEFCKAQGLPYLSWVYDNPCIQLYSYTVVYPTNHIFVFDSDTFLKFHAQNIPTVHYLPMAANPDRLEALVSSPNAPSGLPQSMDIAFVGSLYTEQHDFYSRLSGISSYTEGFLRGIMDAQKKLYGYNLIEESLSPEVLGDLRSVLPLTPAASSVATQEFLFSEYVINRQITAEERSSMLQALSASRDVHIFAPAQASKVPGCRMHGPIDPYRQAPFVYRRAKINLNITLRSIVNGIPLRCFEIMGSGGFLLSNYQGDFAQFFTEGEDYISFDSPQGLTELTDYYLAHDSERKEIAENGRKKIRAAHTYMHRAEEMLSYLS